MSPAEFLSECQRRGVRLSTDGEKVKASGNPPSKPDAFTAYLKHYKWEIIALLAPTLDAASIAPNSETRAPSDTFRQPLPEHTPEQKQELLELGRSIDLECQISELADLLELAIDLERFGDYAPVNIIGGHIPSPGNWLRSAAGRIERIARRVCALATAESDQGCDTLGESLSVEALKIREVLQQIYAPAHRSERASPC